MRKAHDPKFLQNNNSKVVLKHLFQFHCTKQVERDQTSFVSKRAPRPLTRARRPSDPATRTTRSHANAKQNRKQQPTKKLLMMRRWRHHPAPATSCPHREPPQPARTARRAARPWRCRSSARCASRRTSVNRLCTCNNLSQCHRSRWVNQPRRCDTQQWHT